MAYETLLLEGEPNLDYPDVDERNAAILCHTGGTTGLPKGVAYSHRSLWLQAISLCTRNSLGIGANDRVLTVVPMFHVNGWGLPLAAMLAGADLILPGAFLRPNIIADLIRTERPTIAAGVPTIWMDLLAFLGAKAREVIQTLKIIATGGAFVAPKFIETIESYGVRVVKRGE